MAEVIVRSLGGFQVSVGGVEVPAEAWRQRRAAELVKLLALAPGHRLHREQVVDALWPELAPEAGAANLHKAAHYARRALGSPDGIVLRGEQVALWPEATLAVDAVHFEDDAERALRSGDPDACATVAETYGGELLPRTGTRSGLRASVIACDTSTFSSCVAPPSGSGSSMKSPRTRLRTAP